MDLTSRELRVLQAAFVVEEAVQTIAHCQRAMKAGPSGHSDYAIPMSVNGKSFPLRSSGASIAFASA